VKTRESKTRPLGKVFPAITTGIASGEPRGCPRQSPIVLREGLQGLAQDDVFRVLLSVNRQPSFKAR
jgi:hypothetical protein